MPSRLSDAFRAHPVELNHKQLDFKSVKELPESYAWTQPEEKLSGDLLYQESVPIIDLSNPNSQELIGQACKTWGVFQVVNHGIPQQLLNDVECSGRSLFSLPLQEKLKASRSPDGVSGYGVARISSFFPKFMWSEGFTIVGSPLEHARQLWPHDHSTFWYLFHARVVYIASCWSKQTGSFTFLNVFMKDYSQNTRNPPKKGYFSCS